MAILADVCRRGFDAKIAIAPIEKRMLPYILGRGVPPPKNDFRWCTRQIKIEPMQAAMGELLASIGDERLLMLTGMRLGESAIRDRRILTSCSKDGGECGQGHFQSSTTERIDTFAPILHWRVCHVWDWLLEADILYGVPTAQVAEVYGGDEKEELNARTGCIGCPQASKDLALDNLIRNDKYRYLAPLKQMCPIYEAMRSPDRRLRKDGETLKDGSLSANPYRMGPLTPESREYFLDLILEIQTSINIDRGDRPRFDLIDAEEERFIRTCIEDRVFPNGWSGDEPIANISPLTPLEILLKHAD
jgi:DNA sulfur modification protein DndC